MSLRRALRLSLSCALSFALAQATAEACTGLPYCSGERNTVAQNIGWYWQIDAALVVNPRQTRRHGPVLFGEAPVASWVSRFGSVNLNPRGHELPITKIN